MLLLTTVTTYWNGIHGSHAAYLSELLGRFGLLLLRYRQHHFVAMAYLCGPMIWPEFRWFMGACLSVEVNTWFLIVRRVLYKRKDRIHPAILEFVSLSFYMSWIAIRIFLYPTIMYIFVNMYFDAVARTGVWFHWPMIFMPVHFFLCLLNLKWSYDLFQPLITTWLSRSKEQEVGLSSGL